MCGIVGYVGQSDATPILLEGLRRLEYRGYDSAGLAVCHRRRIRRARVTGRVADLASEVANELGSGTYRAGIAHTRWATHGPVTVPNCHPHVDAGRRIAVVHNGILENADELRQELLTRGTTLTSETDTEVLAHLIAEELDDGTLEEATRTVLRRVQGTYGVIVLDATTPDRLVVARNGSPVLIGIGSDEMFVASDAGALVRYTKEVVYLDDGELATVTANDYRTSNLRAERTVKSAVQVEPEVSDYDLGDFADFMAKEIHAQPAAVERVLAGRLDERWATAHLGGISIDARELRGLRRVTFLGCGSAYYAGEAGAALIEELARIPSDAQVASEFRYRDPVIDPDTLYIAVSQSGETADTLMAVQELKRKGARVIGVVNVVGSAIGRECGEGVFLHAGPEISVASTKALTNMTVAFALLGLMLGRIRDLSPSAGRSLIEGLAAIPSQIAEILRDEERIAAIARKYVDAKHMFYIGRARSWPVAREGAQKLKEISYVHAEAYQGGELKHGPLALVDASMPSVVVVPADDLVSKNLATIEQIKARGGPVVVVTNADLPAGLDVDDVITVPRTVAPLCGVLLTIPLQLFAYHLAGALGREIDRPRNLAKSVTVE